MGRSDRRVAVNGSCRSTINCGEDDLDAEPLAEGKGRRAGGGRRAVAEVDPGLIPELARLVEPATLGHPMRPLLWVSKSMDKLAETLTATGHPVAPTSVGSFITTKPMRPSSPQAALRRSLP